MSLAKKLFVAVAILSIFVVPAFGQVSMDLKKIEIRQVPSPSSGDVLAKMSAKTGQWVAIFAYYTVKVNKRGLKPVFDSGAWLDSVELDWNFIHMNPKASNPAAKYFKFSRTVKYRNITEGNHVACLLIEPKIADRYFNGGRSLEKKIVTKLACRVGGKTVKGMGRIIFEGKEDKKNKYAPAFNNENIKVLKGILSTRPESPFHNVQWDVFDTIVSENN